MSLRNRLLPVVAVAILSSFTLTAHADTFQYVVEDNDISVTFDESAILMTGTTILATSFISIDNPYLSFGETNPISVFIDPTATSGCYGYGPALKEADACTETIYASGQIDSDFYLNGPFTSVGTVTQSPGYSVSITDISPVSPVPEPSAFALLGTGVLGLASAARRRFLTA